MVTYGSPTVFGQAQEKSMRVRGHTKLCTPRAAHQSDEVSACVGDHRQHRAILLYSPVLQVNKAVLKGLCAFPQDYRKYTGPQL